MITDSNHPPTFRAAVDAGGTFTGACMVMEKSGRVFSVKVPSTPEDPSRAVMQALAGLCDASGAGLEHLDVLIHGATLAANAIALNQGAKTALLVTRGFRDILHTGRQIRPRPYLPAAGKTPPLVPRTLVFEVGERVLPGGHVRLPLNENEISGFIVPRLQELKIPAVAVCFLHSYENPLHEQRARDIIAGLLPGVPVTISSEMASLPGEYERAVTAVLNAAVTPILGRHIETLTGRLLKGCGKLPGFWVFQSDGGAMPALLAAKEGVRTLLSGPAGGVAACSRLAAGAGRHNLVTLDMGGTAACISIIRKDRPVIKNTGTINGYPFVIPALDIHTAGVGGGSVAAVEKGFLKVGPKSAGISPGPACFGRGGELPTCTDANLILGRIRPESFSAGGIMPELGPAAEAVEKHIAVPLRISVEQAAEGIIKVANSTIVRTLRKIFAGTGYDPREFTLVAFGGAGPVHAAEIARELNMPNVLIPALSGVYPALGMLTAGLKRDYYKVFSGVLADIDPESLGHQFSLLEKKAREEFLSGGMAGPLAIHRRAGIRYKGHPHVLEIQVPSGKLTTADLKLLGRAFGVEYETGFGYSPENTEAEITGVGLTVMAAMPRQSDIPAGVSPASRRSPPASGPVKPAMVIFDGEHFESPVYHSSELSPERLLKGPAVIRQEYSAAVVWPDMSASADSLGNIIINTVVK